MAVAGEMKKRTITQKRKAMLAALKVSMGVVQVACDKVGISRQTHYRWLETNEKYRKSVEDMQEVALDFAESSLLRNIQKGKESSTIFYLKTKGKKRGYLETQVNLNTDVSLEQLAGKDVTELEEMYLALKKGNK